MKHYAVSTFAIAPWNTSNLTWGSLRVKQILTVHRGLVFFMGATQSVHVGYGPHRHLGSASVGLRTLRGRLKGDLTKKSWSDLVDASAREVLSDDLLREDYYAVDRLPWEIHAIDDRFARETTAIAYLRESGAQLSTVDLKYWNWFFRSSTRR